MKKNKIVTLYLFLAIITFFISYHFFDNKRGFIGRQKDILELNTTHFQEKMKLHNIKIFYGYLWGIKETKKIKIKTKKTIVKKEHKIKKEKNNICIDKNCFTFLAIVQKKFTLSALFYSPLFHKNHIKPLMFNEVLSESLYIKQITQNSVTLFDKNSSTQWNFKIFDVNQTKYKPKDKNAL